MKELTLQEVKKELIRLGYTESSGNYTNYQNAKSVFCLNRTMKEFSKIDQFLIRYFDV